MRHKLHIALFYFFIFLQGDIFNGYFSTKNEIEVKQRSGFIGNIDICDIDEKVFETKKNDTQNLLKKIT